MQANTNNVNKQWSLLLTTGDKDKLNIVLSRNRNGQHETQNVMTHDRTTQKTVKRINPDPTKKPGVNSSARKG